MGIEGFGAYLQRLLRDPRKDCSAGCLAQAIGLKDPSSVYSWMRGEVTPRLTSRRIQPIIDHLKLSPAEAQELRRAQIRSLLDEGQGPPKPAKKKRRTPVAPLIERMSQPKTARNDLARDRTVGRAAGGAGIVVDVLELLEGAPSVTRRSDEDTSIVITWQGREPIEMTEALQERWQMALQSVLRRGWTINYMCRLDKNVHRTARIVENMLDFIGIGAYFPRYFTTYGTMIPSYDLVIIPGVAGAILFSGRSADRVDDGIFTQNADHIQTLTAHAHLLAMQTTPLVSAYSDGVAYSSAVSAAEGYSGGRFLVKDGLSVATQPIEWFNEPMLRETPSSDSDRTIATERKKRINDFNRYIGAYDYFDICTEKAIERLATGTVSPTDDLLKRHGQNPRSRLRQLRNVIDLLRTHDRYQLALVSERQARDAGPNGIHMDSKWEVTGDNSVFMTTRVPNNVGRLVTANLHITEPTMAEGFREYFRQMWERIPPTNRDKSEVIARLERYSADLERNIEDATE